MYSLIFIAKLLLEFLVVIVMGIVGIALIENCIRRIKYQKGND